MWRVDGLAWNISEFLPHRESACLPVQRIHRAQVSCHKNLWAGWPSIRAKALSRAWLSCRCEAAVRFARKAEDQDSVNLTLNHFSMDLRSTNHRFGPEQRP